MTRRSTILTAYAEWTAMSAMRSKAPIKAKADIYRLLRGSTFLPLLSPPDRRIEQQEFDEWHKQAVDDMVRDVGRLVAGWAAKLVNAHFQGKGQRPLIEPEPSDHPLYIDYSRGISLERAWDIAHGKH